MNKNLLMPACKSAVGKLLFYIFEITALVIGVIMLIIAIYSSAVAGSFLVFVSGLVSAVMDLLIIYGIGKAIDLLYLSSENKGNVEPEIVEENKEK